ncbi:hypothetical protein JR316_0009259 [Psilocybe cubensis]|uniref:Uncharacterized protein n=2 Tax=Psilocybe cubensis TaxID=181762 RepID=A0A8H8CJ63_PSICU|nr:hypothetical protein JR316_0009259 [Psilocybe cubensis]KAH9478798.1 hypothetical protein JR316_0009259 [Psilocybe cubensis]
MVRLATTVVAATLLVVPALAATQQFERDVSDDVIVTREDLIDILGRDVVTDLEERDPFGFGAIFKLVKTGVKLGKEAHKAHNHVQNAQNNRNNNRNNRHHRRALDEELSARQFEEEFDLASRELLDDLEERAPFGLGFAAKLVKNGIRAGKAAHRGYEHYQQYRREFDEANLLEREYYDDLD